MKSKRYITMIESGEVVKMWDSEEEQMYLNRGGTWEPMRLSLMSHSKFHPYADYEESEDRPVAPKYKLQMDGTYKV